MADNYIIKKKTLTDIADAVRAKKGTSNGILVSNLANEINTIPEGSGSATSKNIYYSFNETTDDGIVINPINCDSLSSITINTLWQTDDTNITSTSHPIETSTPITCIKLDGLSPSAIELKDIEIEDTHGVTLPYGTKWVMTYFGPCTSEAEDWLYGNFEAAQSFMGETIDYLIKLSCGTGEIRDYVYTAYFVHFANMGEPDTFYLAGFTNNFGDANYMSYDEVHNGILIYEGDPVTIKYRHIGYPGTENELEIYYSPATGYIRSNGILQDGVDFIGHGQYEFARFESGDGYTSWAPQEIGFSYEYDVKVDESNNIILGAGANYEHYYVSIRDLHVIWDLSSNTWIPSSERAILALYAYKAIIYYPRPDGTVNIVWSQELSETNGYAINLPQDVESNYANATLGILWFLGDIPDERGSTPWINLGYWSVEDVNCDIIFYVGTTDNELDPTIDNVFVVRAGGSSAETGAHVYKYSNSITLLKTELE